MTDSWRSPRRLALLAIGTVTVLYLVAPMLVIVPMAFTSGQSLSWPPQGFSTQWFDRMLSNPAWTRGFQNSALVATLVAILATILGTIGALGLVRGRFPGKGVANALVLSPLINDLANTGAKFTNFYAITHPSQPNYLELFSGSSQGITGDGLPGVMPFPAANLGANPVQTFRRITFPNILTGVLAGAVFAFITSWDEVVVSIFMTSARFKTLPVEMWEQVRQVVDPTVAAVATSLMAVTTTLFVFAFVIRRQVPGR